MSLENELGRIATALEDLVKVMIATAEAPTDSVKKPAAANPAVPAPPATPASAPSHVPSPPAAPATTAVGAVPAANLTPEDVNEILLAEVARLGGPDAVIAVLKDFNVTSITQLPVEQYQSLIDTVKAL